MDYCGVLSPKRRTASAGPRAGGDEREAELLVCSYGPEMELAELWHSITGPT